jgi:hypothetical protein
MEIDHQHAVCSATTDQSQTLFPHT